MNRNPIVCRATPAALRDVQDAEAYTTLDALIVGLALKSTTPHDVIEAAHSYERWQFLDPHYIAERMARLQSRGLITIEVKSADAQMPKVRRPSKRELRRARMSSMQL